MGKGFNLLFITIITMINKCEWKIIYFISFSLTKLICPKNKIESIFIYIEMIKNE